MNNDDADEKEFEDHYRKQTELSVFASTLILLIFAVLSFMLCKLTLDESKFRKLSTTYDISATIETMERHGEQFSMTVDGVNEGQFETHTFDIDRNQFMRYKQGEEIQVRIKNGRCYIIE